MINFDKVIYTILDILHLMTKIKTRIFARDTVVNGNIDPTNWETYMETRISDIDSADILSIHKLDAVDIPGGENNHSVGFVIFYKDKN